MKLGIRGEKLQIHSRHFDRIKGACKPAEHIFLTCGAFWMLRVHPGTVTC